MPYATNSGSCRWPRYSRRPSRGVALRNELSNYTNTLRSIRDVLLDNENYTSCPLYKRLRDDIQAYLTAMIARIKAAGAMPDDAALQLRALTPASGIGICHPYMVLSHSRSNARSNSPVICPTTSPAGCMLRTSVTA